MALLALPATDVGLWAALRPACLAHPFTGLGMHRLLALGPSNEHLPRNVGGLYLASLVLTVGAIWWGP